MIGVPQTTLRFWEKSFTSLRPRRSGNNVRYYTEADIETIRIINFLVRVKGLKIESAREQLRLNRRNVEKRLSTIDRLEKIKGELNRLLNALQVRNPVPLSASAPRQDDADTDMP